MTSPTLFSPLRWPLILLVGAVTCVLPAIVTRAQDSDAPANGAAAAPADADPAALYTPPPQDDAAVIKAWVEKVSQTPAPDRTPAGLREHFGKLEKAADIVMARDVEESGFIEAMRLKVGANSILEQLGDTTAPKRKQELIARLKQDPRPPVAVHGRLLEVETAASALQPDDNQAAQKLIDQTARLLQEKPITDAHIAVAYTVAETVEANADEKFATTAYNLFSKYLKASDDPRHAGVVEVFEGAARRLNLVGNPLAISGKTLDGTAFNIDSCKGKVVLVDFWATWCGPCLEELPNIKALYDKHHAAGFEVVGVNLDDNLGRVAAFVKSQELTWPQLVSNAGQEHPIANYYGVYQVPTTFIVGRDGKVTAIDLFGEELEEEIERLLGEGQEKATPSS